MSSDTKEILYASFNTYTNQIDSVISPTGAFSGKPAIGYDDMEFFRSPHLVIPKLGALSNWFIQPTKNTNTVLFGMDPIVRIIYEMFVAMIVGDKMSVKISDEENIDLENEKDTLLVKKWLSSPVGKSPDNRGKTVENWVIPKILRDAYTTGASAWLRFVGYNPVSPPDEVGDLMIKWLDPRTYAKVWHDFYGWMKLVQRPRVQWGLPETREAFEQWDPTIKNFYEILSSSGQTLEAPPVSIKSDEIYWFNIFDEPPVNTILQPLTSKLVVNFLRDRFIERATFPFFIIKVPRNMLIDADDDEFKKKLDSISELIAKYRSGDVFAVEGRAWDMENGELVIYSEGWEIQVIEVAKGAINFREMIYQINEEIANGMLSSLGMITSMGAAGRTTSLTTGGYLSQNILQIIKRVREAIGGVFKYIIKDVIKNYTGRTTEIELIDVRFSKIREEDAAQFLNELISLFGIGAMTTNEVRMQTDRIGIPLEPLPPEMTQEGRMMMGMEEMMDQEIEIPPIFLQAKGPEIEMEKIRDEFENESGRSNQ